MILYTFRTFPHKKQLLSVFPNLIILNKINKDLEIIFQKAKNPDLIIGIASRTNTRIETKAINQFQKNKKIIKKGIEEFELYIPNDLKQNFKLARNTTNSYCNLTAYKISDYITRNKLNTKSSFIHVKNDDIDELIKILHYMKTNKLPNDTKFVTVVDRA